MLSLGILSSIVISLATTSTLATSVSGSSTVNVRIEGLTTTIFEATLNSGPRNITTASSEITWPLASSYPDSSLTCRSCDGTNARAHVHPANTPTDALDEASKQKGFTYDGGFDGDFNDFYFDTIAGDVETGNNFFWGSLVNYQISKYGEGLTLSGCQEEVVTGDDVLWAVIPYRNEDSDPAVQFLKVAPAAVTVQAGGTAAVTVTDGTSGAVVQGATIDGVLTDAQGKATLGFKTEGFFQYKATKVGDVRSNVLNVTVRN